MIVLGILVSIAAIGTMCWLLFNLAVFALPFFIGLTAGTWAYGTGAGWLGAILVGVVAAGVTVAVGQGLLMLIRPIWARLLIALAFVVPAGVAGFYATLGILKHMMPSETWQLIFSVIGAIAVGVTAFLRVAGMAASGPADGNLARTLAAIAVDEARCGHGSSAILSQEAGESGTSIPDWREARIRLAGAQYGQHQRSRTGPEFGWSDAGEMGREEECAQPET